MSSRSRRVFGQLRSLLARTPSVSLFQELLQVAHEGEPEAVAHEIVPYLAGVCDDARWSSIHRATPSWLLTVPLSPLVSLCNDLHVFQVQLEHEVWRALAHSPHCAQITSIRLSSVGLRDEDIEVLGAGFGQVHTIDLFRLQGERSPSALVSWADSALVGNLRRLALRDTLVHTAVLEAWSAQAWCGQLERLTLSGAGLDDRGLAHVLRAATPTWRELSLSRGSSRELSSEAIVELAQCEGLSQLRKLDVSMQSAGLQGSVALASSANLRRLEQLNLSENGIGLQGARALAGSTELVALRHLNVEHNDLSEQAYAAFATGLPSLRTLRITQGNTLYGDEFEDWYDWDGSVVGSGRVRLSLSEIRARFFADRPTLQVH